MSAIDDLFTQDSAAHSGCCPPTCSVSSVRRGDRVITPEWCARDMVEHFKPTGRKPYVNPMQTLCRVFLHRTAGYANPKSNNHPMKTIDPLGVLIALVTAYVLVMHGHALEPIIDYVIDRI